MRRASMRGRAPTKGVSAGASRSRWHPRGHECRLTEPRAQQLDTRTVNERQRARERRSRHDRRSLPSLDEQLAAKRRGRRGGRTTRDSVKRLTSCSSSSARRASSCADAAICWVERSSAGWRRRPPRSRPRTARRPRRPRPCRAARARPRRSGRRRWRSPRRGRHASTAAPIASNDSRARSTVAAPSSVRRRRPDDLDRVRGLGLDLADQRGDRAGGRLRTPRRACGPPRRRPRSRGPARRRARPRWRR